MTDNVEWGLCSFHVCNTLIKYRSRFKKARTVFAICIRGLHDSMAGCWSQYGYYSDHMPAVPNEQGLSTTGLVILQKYSMAAIAPNSWICMIRYTPCHGDLGEVSYNASQELITVVYFIWRLNSEKLAMSLPAVILPGSFAVGIDHIFTWDFLRKLVL